MLVKNSPLVEFLNLFDFDSPADWSLALACLLTIAWDQGAGERPAFRITSQPDFGGGKTTLAYGFAALFGGAIQVSDFDSQRMRSIIVGFADTRARCIVIDNHRSGVTEGLESIITQREIVGHQLYVGPKTIENRFTILICGRSDNVSVDLSNRSVEIRLRLDEIDPGRVEKIHAFIVEHQTHIVQRLLNMIHGGPKSKIEGRLLDRFAKWERDILCLLPNANDLMQVILHRRDVPELIS